jgi:hypothetical protein
MSKKQVRAQSIVDNSAARDAQPPALAGDRLPAPTGEGAQHRRATTRSQDRPAARRGAPHDGQTPPGRGHASTISVVPAPPTPAGWSSMREALAERLRQGAYDFEDHQAPASRGRPPAAPFLASVMRQVTLELHDDQENIGRNVTRATRLWQASRMAEHDFVHEVIGEARYRARRQAGVKKPSRDGSDLPNKVPYFFAVVEDLIGLRDRSSTGPHHAPQSR